MIGRSPTIVIVGAGAMGVLTGYHLALAGARIVYLVRPEHALSMPARYRLYSYDDAGLYSFDGFEVIVEAEQVSARAPAFVLVTLDGASLSSQSGRTLLARLGRAIGESGTKLIIGGVGLGLRELAVSETGLQDDHVISGMMALVGHQTSGVDLPIHPPTEPARLAQADFAFRHLNAVGFLLEDRDPGAATEFAEIFDRSRIGKCLVVSIGEFGVQSRGIMPIFAACEILGWPRRDVLFKDPLWPVVVEAMRAIMGLTVHGQQGKVAAATLTSETLAGLWTYLEDAALPLDWQGFNAHQHGAKVRWADIQLLGACVEQGRREGRDMSAVSRLLDALELSSNGADSRG